MLAEVLGRRLTAKLREQATLTYDVSTELEFRLQNRALVTCTRFPANSSVTGLELLLGTIERAGPPTEEEVAVARRQLVARFERLLGSLDGVTTLWVSHRVTGRTFEPKDTLDSLRQVSAGGLSDAWSSVTAASQYQLVILGDRGQVEVATKALKLGKLRTPVLGRVETESRMGIDD